MCQEMFIIILGDGN